MNQKIKKIGQAVAGSALLVGATLTGAAGFAAAQDSGSNSMDLGEYPQPFVDDEGQVQSTVVVGDNAKTADVVGAINVAGSLSQAAMTEEEISVDVAGSFGWNAENGVTLDTRNDDVYFGQSVNAVRETLTEGDVEMLADTTFTDDDNTDYDITHNLNVGDLGVEFSNNGDELEDEDPAVNLQIPTESEVGSGSYVMHLQASMDSIDLEDGDVAGEEIELFGKEFTIASDHSETSDRTYVKLYGSSQDVSMSYSGETVSQTVTIDGEEHTIEVDGVNSDGVIYSVDGGSFEQDTEGNEFTVGDETVRIDSVINKQDDTGTVTFQMGSEELQIYNGAAIEDSEDDEYDGTYAEINGGDWDNTSEEVSSLDVYLGGTDGDEDALVAGETFSHPLFEQAEIQFEGLNPDAATNEEAEEITFSNSGDDTATVSYTTNDGESTSLEFAYDDSDLDTAQFSKIALADSDGDTIVPKEGAEVFEEEYFVSDAGDFAHLWEVTEIDVDGEDTTVDIEDAVTGQQVELEADMTNTEDEDDYFGTEIIDGQEYKFKVDADDGDGDDPALQIVWGDGATLTTNDSGEYDGVVNTGGGGLSYSNYDYDSDEAPGATSLFPALDTETGSAVALTQPLDTTDYTFGSTEVFELPSTESTDAQTVQMDTSNDLGSGLFSGADEVASNEDGNNAVDVRVGQLVYNFEFDGSSHDTLDSVSLDGDQEVDSDNGEISSPAAVVMQPEDDSDNEHAYVVQPGVDTDDEEMSVGESGNVAATDSAVNLRTLESDDDIEAAYSTYGTYAEVDSSDQGDVTLRVPMGQSTVGAAVTGMDGELSAESGASASATTQTPTGWPDAAALDSEITQSDKQSQNMILVGGPAVNTLTQELADADKTMAASEYTEGQGMVQLVEGAFAEAEGQDALVVAGHSDEDTRAASSFIANYQDHQEDLDGAQEVTVSTQTGQVVQ